MNDSTLESNQNDCSAILMGRLRFYIDESVDGKFQVSAGVSVFNQHLELLRNIQEGKDLALLFLDAAVSNLTNLRDRYKEDPDKFLEKPNKFVME